MRQPVMPLSAHAPTALAVALGAGVLGAVQPKLNAVLGARVGSAMLASVVNFFMAFAVVAIVLPFKPKTRHTLRRLPSWPVPRWTLTAGLGGALIVLAGALAVETIGVAIFSVAFFAGQITFGLLVDRIGVGPGGQRPLSAARVQAALLAVTAVVLSQIGRPVGEFAPGLVAFVVTAGAGFAFQSAFNGRIAAVTGDAFAATAVNVTVGLMALFAVLGGLALAGDVGTGDWPSEPWLYAGGLLGITIVLSLAVATRALGVLRATLGMLAAQLVAAFVVDWIVQRTAPRPGAIAGSVLIVVAVGLVRRMPVNSGPEGSGGGVWGRPI